MIVVSDNDATAYLVDILANTVPGPPLQGRALNRYIERRRDINQRFQKLGYADNVSAMMKPWSFGPFGVDQQVLGENRVNRNKLTANATRVAAALDPAPPRAGRARDDGPPRSARSRRCARRRTRSRSSSARRCPTDAQLWSKAGWTSEVRHDAAYIELPSGRKLILVIFTRGTADDVTLVPAIARNVLGEL